MLFRCESSCAWAVLKRMRPLSEWSAQMTEKVKSLYKEAGKQVAAA